MLDERASVDELRLAVADVVRSTLAPRPRLKPSEWSERYIRLPKRTTSRAGAFRLFPFQVGMVDAIVEPGVEEVVFLKAARTGYTQCLAIMLAYWLETDGRPLVSLFQNEGSARRFRDTYLAPMVEASPILREILPDLRDQLWHSPEALTGATLSLKWATKPDAFADYSAARITGDEVDRSSWSPGSEKVAEGDKLEMMRKRLDSFDDGIQVLGSSPGTTEGSRIRPRYEAGDQRKWHIRCPQCGEEQVPVWGGRGIDHGVTWDRGREDAAYYVCLSGCVIEPDYYDRAVLGGRWIPTAVGQPGVVSFHVPGLISPFKKSSLGALAPKFVEAKRAAAKGEFGKLQVFINTSLGETWDTPEVGPRVEPHALEARREDYGAEVPDWAKLLVFGADTQDGKDGETSFQELSVYAVGAGETMGLVGHWRFDALGLQDPRHWQELQAFLDTPFRTADGREMRIAAGCLDTGSGQGNGQYVVEFCNRMARQGRRWFPVKGASNLRGERKDAIWPKAVSNVKKGGYLYTIDTWSAKDRLYPRMTLAPDQPGAIRFPELQVRGSMPCDGTFFQRLTRERPKPMRGQPGVTTWADQPRDQEPWDTLIYSYAALHALYSMKGGSKIREALEADGPPPAPVIPARSETDTSAPKPAAKPAPRRLPIIRPASRRG